MLKYNSYPFFSLTRRVFKHASKDLLGNCIVLYSHLRLPHASPKLTAMKFQVAQNQLLLAVMRRRGQSGGVFLTSYHHLGTEGFVIVETVLMRKIMRA